MQQWLLSTTAQRPCKRLFVRLLELKSTVMDELTTLPSLIGLRSFEATARHLSLTKASGELCVSPSAVSHQIKKLETAIAVPLLIRLHQRIELTSEGERLFRILQQSFSSIRGTIGTIRKDKQKQVLSVSVSPYFSAKWLTPRLQSFWVKYPHIDLQLHHSYSPADYFRERIDVGINWGKGQWPHTHSEMVLGGALTPICTPAFAKRHRIRHPKDLLRCKLLHEFDISDWSGWFQCADVASPKRLVGVQLDDSHSLLGAALDECGVALFFKELIHKELETGTIFRPFQIDVDTGNAYYLNSPTNRPAPYKVRAFKSWVKSEIAKVQEMPTVDPKNKKHVGRKKEKDA